MVMRKTLLTFVLFLAAASFAYSQEKEFKPEVKIGGTLYSGWEYNAGDAEFINSLDLSAPDASQPFGYAPVKNQFETSKNSFYLERAYINVMASLTPQIKARFTPDVYSYKDNAGATQFAYQVKFAWAEYTPLTTDEGISLSFTGGVIPNLWVGNVEKNFGYRGAIKTMTDFQWTTAASVNTTTGSVTRTTASFFSTADLGLSSKFVFPKKYADLNVAIYNGNGFRNLSFDNRFKDFMASAFVYPLAGDISKKTDAAKKSGRNRINGISDLTFGGYAYIGKLGSGEGQTAKSRFGGMANFKYNFDKAGFIKVGGEVGSLSNQAANPVNLDSNVTAFGISTWLEFNPPVEELKEKLSLVARFDMYDPNTDKPGTNLTGFNADNGKQNLLMVGLFFKPANMLTLGLNYQMQSFEKDFAVKYDGTPTSSISRVFFNTILEF
jgi:hypothetical protein